MNKLLIFCVLIAPLTAKAMQESICIDGLGEVITTETGTYCKSSMRLNWWSARAWCMSLDSDLVDLSNICVDYYNTGECPQISGGPAVKTYTNNVPDSDSVYLIDLSSGEISTYYRTHPYAISWTYYALCR